MDHLRSVYYPIQDLQNHEETFLARATQEYETRLKTDDFAQPKKSDRANKKDEEAIERDAAFSKYLNTFSRQLKLLSRTYQVIMKWDINFVDVKRSRLACSRRKRTRAQTLYVYISEYTYKSVSSLFSGSCEKVLTNACLC